MDANLKSKLFSFYHTTLLLKKDFKNPQIKLYFKKIIKEQKSLHLWTHIRVRQFQGKPGGQDIF